MGTDERVVVKTTTDEPVMNIDEKTKKQIHFTIADMVAYRIETDLEKRTAMCSMNDAQTAKMAAQFFDDLFNKDYVKKIDLKTLFDKNGAE